jgi:hypothetical protein
MSGTLRTFSKDRIMLQYWIYCGAQTGGLTALPRGIIVRLHETAHQGTIGEKELAWQASKKAVTGLPQPSCKK